MLDLSPRCDTGGVKTTNATYYEPAKIRTIFPQQLKKVIFEVRRNRVMGA